jgi:hypothetical protein
LILSKNEGGTTKAGATAEDDSIIDDQDTTCDFTSGTYLKNMNMTISWVSTESHSGTVGTDTNTTADNDERSKTAWDVITHTSSNGDRTPTIPESVTRFAVTAEKPPLGGGGIVSGATDIGIDCFRAGIASASESESTHFG